MSDLEKITLLHGYLSRLRPLPADVVQELGNRFTIRLTHHSTAIEGNTLSQSETEIIVEKGITIGGKSVREHLEVIGHKEALDFVLALADRRESITERDIRDIHALVMKGQANRDAGAYRGLNVRAAGTEFAYPDHLHVPELMGDFVSWLNAEPAVHAVAFASEAHFRFVSIHPFRDGNGRVGRLLLNFLLLRRGYSIAVIPVERRAEYIDSLVVAQSGKGNARLLDLVASAVENSLVETLSVCMSSADMAARLDATDRHQLAALLSE
jgi:Fic family protein